MPPRNDASTLLTGPAPGAIGGCEVDAMTRRAAGYATPAHAHFGRAVQFYRKERPKEALSEVEAALRTDAGYVPALVLAGDLYTCVWLLRLHAAEAVTAGHAPCDVWVKQLLPLQRSARLVGETR